MRDIESILLTYENINRLEYQYCAEFFRLIGVYVCENLQGIDGSEEVQKEKHEFSEQYVIGGRKGTQKLIDYLRNVVQYVFKLQSIDGWLGELVSLYDNMKLMQASCTLQYYYKMKKEYRISEAGKIFEDIVDKFTVIEQKYVECLENRHFLYARLYCKEKANFAKYHYEGSYVYFIDELAEEGVKIIKKFQDFSNAWVLLGLIYEVSDKYFRDAADAFEQGIEMIGEKPYVASVYYWLGRLYEGNRTLQTSSEDSYIKAYNAAERYRNVYKIATFHFNRMEWKSALFYYEKCIELIEKKGNYLDPLEQEYYFKVCVQMSMIYLKLEDYANAIIKAISALELRNHIKEESIGVGNYTKFYRDVYNEPQIYIDLTIKKMSPQNVYRNLVKACQESGLKDDEEYYWDLYKQWL